MASKLFLKGQKLLNKRKSSIFKKLERSHPSCLSYFFLFDIFSSLFFALFLIFSLFFLAFPCEWRFPAGTVTDTQKQTLFLNYCPANFLCLGPILHRLPHELSRGCQCGMRAGEERVDGAGSGPGTIAALLVRHGAGCWRGKQFGDDNKRWSFSRAGIWRSRKVSAAPVRVEVRGRDCSSWEPRVQDGIHSIQFPLQA